MKNAIEFALTCGTNGSFRNGWIHSGNEKLCASIQIDSQIEASANLTALKKGFNIVNDNYKIIESREKMDIEQDDLRILGKASEKFEPSHVPFSTKFPTVVIDMLTLFKSVIDESDELRINNGLTVQDGVAIVGNNGAIYYTQCASNDIHIPFKMVKPLMALKKKNSMPTDYGINDEKVSLYFSNEAGIITAKIIGKNKEFMHLFKNPPSECHVIPESIKDAAKRISKFKAENIKLTPNSLENEFMKISLNLQEGFPQGEFPQNDFLFMCEHCAQFGLSDNLYFWGNVSGVMVSRRIV